MAACFSRWKKGKEEGREKLFGSAPLRARAAGDNSFL